MNNDLLYNFMFYYCYLLDRRNGGCSNDNRPADEIYPKVW